MGLVLSLSRRKSIKSQPQPQPQHQPIISKEMYLAQAIHEIENTILGSDACAEIEPADIVISRIMPMPKNTPKR